MSAPGALIGRSLPRFDARTTQHVVVDAAPAATYEAIWAANLLDSPLARGLVELSLLPERAVARLRGGSAPGHGRRAARLRDALAPGSPWILLAEQPGAEVVLGLLWTPPAGGDTCEPREFREFATPGFAKVAWGLSVTPYGIGSLLSTETRTATTDAAAKRRFRLMWLVIAPFAGLARRGMLRSVKAEAERRNAG